MYDALTMATSARPPALPARKHQSSALMLTFGSANTLIRARSRRRKAAHRKAVAGTETQATTLVQEVAQLQEKIKDLEAELTKDKAAADRRALAIDPNNADGFDYEREDADTGGKQS